MRFQLLPILNTMLELYQKPRDINRFQAYLRLLQGETKGDLVLPISGFNPMGKKHVLDKLTELKRLQAEQCMEETLQEVNQNLTKEPLDTVINVSLCLSDDLLGGWTNRYTSDYDSKFKLNALVKRQFCTPVFWTSEVVDTALIKERTWEYAYRTSYWLTHSKPITLQHHVEQEIAMASKMLPSKQTQLSDFEKVDAYYQQHKAMGEYARIFNFFYGDEVCQELGFATFGIREKMTGYTFAKILGKKQD